MILVLSGTEDKAAHELVKMIKAKGHPAIAQAKVIGHPTVVYCRTMNAPNTIEAPFVINQFRFDKFRQYQLLRKNNIPTPETIHVTDLSSVRRAVNHLGYPVVFKPLHASHSHGVRKFSRSRDLKHVRLPGIAQEYVEAGGKSIRVMVVGDSVSCCSLRTARDGFRAAFVGGRLGTVSEIEITDEEKKMSIAAARACFRHPVVGIDLLRDEKNGKTCILEVNHRVVPIGAPGIEKSLEDTANYLIELSEAARDSKKELFLYKTCTTDSLVFAYNRKTEFVVDFKQFVKGQGIDFVEIVSSGTKPGFFIDGVRSEFRDLAKYKGLPTLFRFSDSKSKLDRQLLHALASGTDKHIGGFEVGDTRHIKMLKVWEDAGINSPRILENPKFPCLIRECVGHMGLGHLRKVNSFRELTQLRTRYKNPMLLEWIDVMDEDSHCRKYRSFFVGDTIIHRSLNVSGHWEVRLKSTIKSPEFSEEDRKFVEDGELSEHDGAVVEAAKALGLDFGAADYSFKDGVPVFWEAVKGFGIAEIDAWSRNAVIRFYGELLRRLGVVE